MNLTRRGFLPLPAAVVFGQTAGPPPPIAEPHFPSRLYLFIWRNWEIANLDRIAAVIGAAPEQVLEAGADLGLPAKPKLTEDQLRRIYITVIRQNWHVIPNSQIIELLGWTRQRFDFTLKEDDFLDHKLGAKPALAELRYAPPSPDERAHAARIRRTVRALFGGALDAPHPELFHFVHELSSTGYASVRDEAAPPPGAADLTHGWTIAPVADPFAMQAALRLSRYFKEAMRADVPVKAGGDRVITLVPEKSARGFHTTVQAKSITISGDVWQGISALQDEMEENGGPFAVPGERRRNALFSLRYLYSYFALYGDPLADTEADPFPDGYIEKLARAGINGVWLQGLLNNLAPSRRFREFGDGCEGRLRNLDTLARRAARFGVKVYLYLNEPRAQPDPFFRAHPDVRGSRHQDLWAMCTSHPEVREWIAESLSHIFAAVPDLGGIFTISMSENHTNCFSHGGAWRKEAPNAGDCPRCARRGAAEVLAELFHAMREGVRRSSASAEIIHYDWGWPDDLSAAMIPMLDKDVSVLSISEWSKPVERGGVKTRVGEYSISVVGPGPRATANWDRAAKAGLARAAKVQFNNTWEISAVPYVPVPQLIAEHMENLRNAGVSQLMASWTCGGYPGPNLDVAKAFYTDAGISRQEAVLGVARRRYGRRAAPAAVEAWRLFSEAFQEFPFGVAIYILPVQHGPANLLRLKPTGHKPGMILFPHDAVRAWCAAYPPAVVQSQMTRLASRWKEGLAVMERAARMAPDSRRSTIHADLAVARTCYHHFQSVANQVEFCLLRENPRANRRRLAALAKAEIDLARRQFPLARQWTTIGYEASNHYYYTPLDLVEKVLNCRQVIDQLASLSA